MKINCTSCGFSVDLDDEAYSDYEGQVKCYTCGALLAINVKEGHIKSLQFLMVTGRATAEL